MIQAYNSTFQQLLLIPSEVHVRVRDRVRVRVRVGFYSFLLR